jgi:DNA-binding response OmpR family regulator/curved DNA-binding protein CbpA
MTKIVIAEDSQDQRDILADLLRARGYDVVGVGNGVEAEAAAKAEGVDLLVMDLLLPKKQGLQVIEALRSGGKSSLPIVIITGVFKSAANQKDAKERLAVKEYLVKPFDNDTFLNAVDGALGKVAKAGAPAPERPAAEAMPARGHTQDIPAGLLIFRAHQERHTGILDLVAEEERMRLFFQRGALSFAQSSREGRHLGAELVRRGRLSEDALKLATMEMGKSSVGLYKALCNLQVCDEATAKDAYKALVPHICAEAVGFLGKFQWTVNDTYVRVLPLVNVSVLPVLMEGLKGVTAKQALQLLEKKRGLRAARGPVFDRLNPGVERVFGVEASRAVNGRARVNQIIEAASNAEDRGERARQLYALLCLHCVVTTEGAEAVVRAEPASREEEPESAFPGRAAGKAARAPATSGLAPEVEEILAEVDQRFASLGKQNHFEVLGVTDKEDGGALKRAYFALAGKFHADKFSGLDLGDDTRRKVDAVFGCIRDAYETLSKPDKRAEYEAELKLKASGATVNLGAIFEAESQFSKAEQVLERGDFATANKLLDHALELDAKELYRAYKLYVGFRVAGNPKDKAAGVIKEIEALSKEVTIPKAMEFMAMVARLAEDYRTARVWFRKMLEDPMSNKTLAQRELAYITKKVEDDEKKKEGGLVGRFFKS